MKELLIVSILAVLGLIGPEGVTAARAQSYPAWFLNQSEVGCGITAIGYTNATLHSDSAAAHAFRNACEVYARQLKTRISGGEAFWSTEIGTFWMGNDFEEQFDDKSDDLASILKPIDTLVISGFVAVLVGSKDCQLGQSHLIRQSIGKSHAPFWTDAPPNDNRYSYGVGVAPGYFYEMSSWAGAERRARLSLARSIHVNVRSMQKVETKEGQEIRNEELAATLQNIEVAARWVDVNEKIFYVLVRMPR